MAWRVFGERFDTADFSGTPRVFQPVTFHRELELKAIRTWLIYYNSPTFTNLSLRIYSDIGGSLGQLIATANTVWTGTQISSLANACKEVYFEFTNAPSFKAEDDYNISLWATGYTGDDTAHLAWVRSVPDPVNPLNVTVSLEKAAVLPFKLGFIGREL
jgi:hypothetical protein